MAAEAEGQIVKIFCCGRILRPLVDHSFRQFLLPFFSIGCLIELKFCEVSWKKISMLKISAFYLEKQKSLMPKKIWAKPRVNCFQYQNNQLCLLTQFFSDGFGIGSVRRYLVPGTFTSIFFTFLQYWKTNDRRPGGNP